MHVSIPCPSSSSTCSFHSQLLDSPTCCCLCQTVSVAANLLHMHARCGLRHAIATDANVDGCNHLVLMLCHHSC